MNSSGWCPTQEIELMAGTPPGGGQERPARALIDVLGKHKLVDQPVKLTNIPGRGSGNAWNYLRDKSGDPHVLAIGSPTIISNRLTGVSDLSYSDLTPLANLYAEYPIFVVRPASSLTDAVALITRLKADTGGVQIALATAIGNTNHVALARLVRHAGGDAKSLNICVFDSARFAVAHVIDGKAELGVITAVSAVPELTAGRLRALVLSGPRRIGGIFENTPTLLECGVDCEIGMWRGIIAAPEIAPLALWRSGSARSAPQPRPWSGAASSQQNTGRTPTLSDLMRNRFWRRRTRL